MTAIRVEPPADNQVQSMTLAGGGATDGRKTRRRAFYVQAHLQVSQAIFAGIILQVFFAGLGLFSSAGFLAHALFAPALGAITLTLPLLARLGGVQHPLVMRSWGLVGLMLVQGLLIDLGRWVWMPLSSLHPVNALALILVAYSLARRRAADRL
jgi:Family of unknown function (DUF6220)